MKEWTELRVIHFTEGDNKGYFGAMFEVTVDGKIYRTSVCTSRTRKRAISYALTELSTILDRS